jgi:hypothetical protein
MCVTWRLQISTLEYLCVIMASLSQFN